MYSHLSSCSFTMGKFGKFEEPSVTFPGVTLMVLSTLQWYFRVYVGGLKHRNMRHAKPRPTHRIVGGKRLVVRRKTKASPYTAAERKKGKSHYEAPHVRIKAGPGHTGTPYLMAEKPAGYYAASAHYVNTGENTPTLTDPKVWVLSEQQMKGLDPYKESQDWGKLWELHVLQADNLGFAFKMNPEYCTSGYRGVSREDNVTSSKRWRAWASKDGKQIDLGYFATEEEAARVYDEFIGYVG